MDIKKGIIFNGVHSYYDLGLTMPNDPQVVFPRKVKSKTRIPGTNIIYDKVPINNIQEYEEREIKVTFNIIDFEEITIRRTHDIATKVLNAYMGPVGKHDLILDIMPGWKFKAEVESTGAFDTDYFEYGVLELTFKAYPYKLSTSLEGFNEWDTLYFPTDVLQNVVFETPLRETQMPYRSLSVGNIVHIGAWSESIGGARIADVRNYRLDSSYDIKEKRTGTSASSNILDLTQYRLGEMWIWAQDIVEANTKYTEAKLYNVSSSRIFPNINIKTASGRLPGITIIKDGQRHQFSQYSPRINPGDPLSEIPVLNTTLYLDPGENNLTIYGDGQTVTLEWYKEVL